MKIDTIKNQVESILRDFPEARNSDITLMIELWKKFYPEMISSGGRDVAFVADFVALKVLYDLPSEDVISRARRLIQADVRRSVELRYLPTRWEVAQRRKIGEEMWRRAMGQH